MRTRTSGRLDRIHDLVAAGTTTGLQALMAEQAREVYVLADASTRGRRRSTPGR